jgi:putative aldouronate transport system substrate-binding protein
MKRLMTMLIALILCISSVTVLAAEVSGPNEFPIVDEKITLDVWCYQRPTVDDLWTNRMTEWYEEKTNIHINWIIVPQAEETTKLNLSIASGEYPDIYLTYFSAAQANQLGTQGVLIPLNDLIEKHAYYTTKRLEANPEYKEWITAPDGNIYTLYNDDIGLHMQAQEKMFVNTEWLAKYKQATGKEIVTTEDFREMLRYFRDNDMNGNGNATDEIPLVGSNGHTGGNPLWFLMNPFQVVTATNMLNVSEEGKISASYVTDGWREGLKYINSLYEEGLIAEESFVQDKSQMKALSSRATAEEMICGAVPGRYQGDFIDSGIIPYVSYTVIDPLVSPAGVQQTGIRNVAFKLQSGITTQCEYPEAALKWLDWFYGLEGSMLNTRGWEGINFEWRNDLTNILGTSPAYVQLTGLASSGAKQNDYWYLPLGCDSAERRYCEEDTEGSASHLLYYDSKHYIEEFGVKTNWPAITWGTEEQINTIALTETTITDYVISSAVNFILGNLDIESDDDWQTYLEELNAMGLENYLATQEAIINGIT